MFGRVCERECVFIIVSRFVYDCVTVRLYACMVVYNCPVNAEDGSLVGLYWDMRRVLSASQNAPATPRDVIQCDYVGVV